MSKVDSLVSNYNKQELAQKVLELSEKLEEMKTVEAQVTATTDSLSGGESALGVVRDKAGMFQLVKIVYDLSKNAAVIVGTQDLDRDGQIAAGKLVKETGTLFYKAADIKL